MKHLRLFHFTALALAFFADAASADPVPGTALDRLELRDPSGRTITYYTNHPARPAPVLLMIQGSGCGTIVRTGGTSSYSTFFDLLPFAQEGRYKIVAVEKPFADAKANGGTADKCSAEFRADFTAESWLAALQAVLGEVRKAGDADPKRVIVMGTSEGAVMASLLAGRDNRITHAVLVSGSGTSQLFDFLALAYQTCFDRSACIADIETQLRAVRADPQSAEKLAWGHPHKRWTSFFAVDPGAELLRSKARVYWALGTADENVPALSQEVAIAKLLTAGRDVTVRRVPGGDHMLAPAGSNDFSALDREYRKALDWALSPP